MKPFTLKKMLFFLPLLVFIVLAFFLMKGLNLNPSDLPSALIDKPMPVFSLPELNNSEQRLTENDLQGEVTLLNVWATWCVSCRMEHETLLKLSEQGVKLVGLNYKDDNAEAKKWLIDLGNPYQFIIVDQTGRLGLDLGVFGAPETFILDKKGTIRYKHVGVIDERIWLEQIESIYDQLLAE